jgi:hypothetical protein
MAHQVLYLSAALAKAPSIAHFAASRRGDFHRFTQFAPIFPIQLWRASRLSQPESTTNEIHPLCFLVSPSPCILDCVNRVARACRGKTNAADQKIAGEVAGEVAGKVASPIGKIQSC